MRDVLAKVTKANAEMVAAAIRTIFAQPDAAAVAAQFERITATLEGQFPEVTAMLVHPGKTCWPSVPSPSSTAARCGARTPCATRR